MEWVPQNRALLRLLFRGRFGCPTKIDKTGKQKQKKVGTLLLTSLLEGPSIEWPWAF